MKKVITILITLALLLTLAPAAFADGVDVMLSVAVATWNETAAGQGEYTFTHIGDLIIVKFSGEMIDEICEKAKTMPSYKTVWDTMIPAISDEAKLIKDSVLETLGVQVVVIDCIVSTANPGEILLAASEGEILIDVVNGVNKFAE